MASSAVGDAASGVKWELKRLEARMEMMMGAFVAVGKGVDSLGEMFRSLCPGGLKWLACKTAARSGLGAVG